MFSDAFTLALLSTGAFMVVYKKLPRKLRKFVEKYSLAADILALLLVYLLFGSTLTALMAGAIVGLFVSALLHVAANEQDFLFLYDLRDFVKDRLTVVQQTLKDFGKVYRDKRNARIAATFAAEEPTCYADSY